MLSLGQDTSRSLKKGAAEPRPYAILRPRGHHLSVQPEASYLGWYPHQRFLSA